MAHNSKFNKSKCATCIYHSRNSGRVGKQPIICNYSGITGHTCLTSEGRKVVDKRGDDFDNCKLRKVGTRGHMSSKNKGGLLW